MNLPEVDCGNLLQAIPSGQKSRGYMLARLTRKDDGRTFILHLLNYDHHLPAEREGPACPERSSPEPEALGDEGPSPDVAQSQFAGLSLHQSIAEFTLGRIEHFTGVTLSPKPCP